jgi:cation:H+ antiporter
LVWLKFSLCLVIILFAGTRLARYGDAIAEKTGMGRIWIGLVLLAAITSMPELVTGISSAALVGLPDLALGDLLGSCMFNLLILAVLDILYRPAPVLSQASPKHMVSAGMGILLIAIAAGSIFAGGRLSGLTVGWVGAPSIIISSLYIVGVWWMFRSERSCQPQPIEAVSPRYKELSTKTVYIRFALAAAAIIVAGIWLSFIGEELAATYHWHAGFVGSLFLAISTSVPELVVTIAALRMGAIDMAVANILGSNMFNLAIIAPVDLSYKPGPLLSLVSPAHLITTVLAMVMTLLVVIGLRFPQKGRALFIGWYTPVLIGLYIFGMYYLFTSGIGLG